MTLEEEHLERLAKIMEDSAIENMAQLTRFVTRGSMTKEQAASLAWDLSAELIAEYARRLEKRK